MFTKWKILCSLFRDTMCYFGWGNSLLRCLAQCKLTSLTCEWYLVLFTCCGQSKTGQWGEAWQQGYLQCVLASYQISSNGNRIVSVRLAMLYGFHCANKLTVASLRELCV